MNEVNNINKQLHLEKEYKNFLRELKKIRKENEKTLSNEKTSSAKRIKNIKDEFRKSEETLNNQLQSKLIKLRNTHKHILNQEKVRLDNEVLLLKKSHEDKMVEITETNANQIDQKNDELENKLNTLEMQYEREKSKLS